MTIRLAPALTAGAAALLAAAAPAAAQTPPPGPTVIGASLTNKEFAVGPQVTALTGAAKPKPAPKPAVKVGTTMRLKVSAAGQVRVLVQQREFGREVSGRCVAQTTGNKKKPKCERLKLRGTLTRAVRKAGLKRIAFSGRLPDGILRPDAYQFSISILDKAKVRSAEKLIRFRVVPGS
jgi:hypothetical protein